MINKTIIKKLVRLNQLNKMPYINELLKNEGVLDKERIDLGLELSEKGLVEVRTFIGNGQPTLTIINETGLNILKEVLK